MIEIRVDDLRALIAERRSDQRLEVVVQSDARPPEHEGRRGRGDDPGDEVVDRNPIVDVDDFDCGVLHPNFFQISNTLPYRRFMAIEPPPIRVGIIEPIDTSRLKNWDKVMPNFKNMEGFNVDGKQ